MSEDLQARQARARAPATGAGQLLRLALDLQVDALLFSVSADATSNGSPLQSLAHPGSDSAPWERWLTGDLEAVRRMAEGVVKEHLPLPAVLSGAHRRENRVLDDLRARYTTILALLSEAAAEFAPKGTVARTVSDLRKHYEERLREVGGGSMVPRPSAPFDVVAHPPQRWAEACPGSDPGQDDPAIERNEHGAWMAGAVSAPDGDGRR